MPGITAVFDLDGTLTDTSAVDAECFMLALRDTFGIVNVSADWETYAHVTDSGILQEILAGARKSPLKVDEQDRFITNFVKRLDQAHADSPQRFSEIPGSGAFLDQVERLGWSVAIATGGWRASAIRKLHYAGIEPERWPIATADDASTRTDIVRHSLVRAGVQADALDNVVLFGDALWDVRTARDMRLPIVAVAPGTEAARLRTAGANVVISDYLDWEAIVARIEALLGF